MAFNEAGSLSDTVEEIQKILTRTALTYEIVIVDDGSSDATGTLAEQLCRRLDSVRVIHHHENRGLGGVYQTGFEQARGELVTFYPADGQFPATNITEFLREIDGRDMVLGYLSGRRETGIGKTLSWCERRLYEAVVGPIPRFQGLLMFRRGLLDRLAPRCKGRGWGILMEFIIRVHRSEAVTVSVPTSYRPRSRGRSKVNNWRTVRANLLELWMVRSYLAK
jgi:glycosyltransferase involved in cell wall biosynthesis